LHKLGGCWHVIEADGTLSTHLCCIVATIVSCGSSSILIIIDIQAFIPPEGLDNLTGKGEILDEAQELMSK
jgi:hypothetical protein